MNQEIEKQFNTLIQQIEVLLLTYTETQSRCLTEEINMPAISRLFELIHQLERFRLDEIRRFIVRVGAKIQPVGQVQPINITGKKPVEILKVLIEEEKKVLSMVNQLAKLAVDKAQMEVVAFLNERIILRLQKVVFRRQQQIHSLENQGVSPLMVDELTLVRDVRHLERRVLFEQERRNWTKTSIVYGNETTTIKGNVDERFLRMPGSNTRF